MKNIRTAAWKFAKNNKNEKIKKTPNEHTHLKNCGA